MLTPMRSIILNYKLISIKTLNYAATFIILFYGIHKITINSNYSDVYYRLQLNDSVNNLLYFFWTQFFYLPPFFYLILFLSYVLAYTTPKINIIIGALTITNATLYSINNYYFLNTTESVLYNLSMFNLLLTNPINKYHPLLFYLTSLLVLVLLLQTSPVTKLFFKNTLLRSYLVPTIIIAYLLTLTLFFGAWWALQEGSWGGWWNWDASEVFGLLSLTVLLAYTHKNTSKNLLPTNHINFVCALLLPLTYTFVQLNFDLISHNFGIREVGPTTSNNYLVLAILAVAYYVKKIFTKIKNNAITIGNSTGRSIPENRRVIIPKSKILSILLSILTLLYLPSFYPLLNNIFWKCLHLNLLNSLYTEYIVMSFLWVILFSWFFIISYAVSTLVISLPHPVTPLLLFSHLKFCKVGILHFSAITLLISAFVYSNSTFIVYNVAGSSDILSNLYTSVCDQHNLLYNTFSLTIKTTRYSGNLPADYIATQACLNLSNLPQNFLHLLCPDGATQALNSGLVIHPFIVNVIEVGPTQTNTLFILTLLLILYCIQVKSKIVF